MVDRSGIRTRPILAGILEAELVRRPRRQEGDEASVHGMRPILFQAVRAHAPRVHIERAVLLLGPGVVVLERQVVTIGQPEVELCQGRPRVVGAGDRGEVTRELGIPGCEERLQGVGRRGTRPVLLLYLVIDLLVIGEKEERPNSALAPVATTTSSLTASRLNVNAGRCSPRCSPKNVFLNDAATTETL